MTVYLVYHKDHTIGQSGFNAEVSHYHGLGEQYFMQSMHTNSVTLQCSSQHQSPSPPKFTLLAWTYNDYVFNVTDSLLFLPSTEGFSARLAQTGFFPHQGFIFPRAMLIVQSWG
jgi:hypothetical protein